MKKRLILILIAIVVLAGKSQAQFPSPYVVPNIDWINYYSQRDAVGSTPTALDANSNIYLTGYSGSTSASTLVALKYDSTGASVFVYNYVNIGFNSGNAIKIDGNGNALITGITEDASTGWDYFIAKLDPAGTQIWQTSFDAGMGGSIDKGVDIGYDQNGDVYVTGSSQNGNGDFDITTLKLDATSGSLIWSHIFNGASSLNDEAVGLTLSADGNTVYVTGNSMDVGNGNDIVTFALNASNGSLNWGPIATNGNANTNDYSRAILCSGGNIFVCGEITNTATASDALTLKYDGGTGSILFQDEYDAYSGANNRATALTCDSAGNIGVVGVALNGSVYEYHTVLYTGNGFQYALNKESTGLTSLATEPKICNDTIAHHWYVSGEKQRVSKDVFVYQITPAGNTSWETHVDGQYSDVDCAMGIAVNGIGVVYVGALSRNISTNFDLTAIKLNQTPAYWPPDFNSEPVNLGHLYLRNEGQLVRTDSTSASEVLYYTHHTNPSVYIEHDGFNFVFNRSDTAQSTLDTLERIRYKFLYNNQQAGSHEYLPRSTSYNYYLSYAAATVVENVKGNERIFIPNYYPYIDLHYFSGPSGLKYYLVVKPGAHLGELTMEIEGANATSIETISGKLGIDGALGDIVLAKPIAYTSNTLGAVVTITGSASWQNVSGNIYKILPPAGYNPALPLIIQVSAALPSAANSPNITGTNLEYSTYKGGTNNDVFNDVSVRPNGDRSIAGYATGNNFPVQNGVGFYNGSWDMVLLHYTSDDSLRVATFMGGEDLDWANTVAYDSQGNIFVGGATTSTTMFGVNVTGATNQFNNGGASGIYKQDGFLAKFLAINNNTTSLVWRRYFGGSHSDEVKSIHVDGSDNLYVTGWTYSNNFPVFNAFKSTGCATTAANPGNQDAIFGKFNSSLSAQWITYYGGSANGVNGTLTYDQGTDIVVDNSGRVIGCGSTDANNLATLNSTGQSNTFYKTTIGGQQDGFLVRYSSSGTPDFSSYFGGSNSDGINRLVYKSSPNELYFAGTSRKGTGFPFYQWTGAFYSQYSAGGMSAYVGRLDGNLNQQWCTYWGKGQVGAKFYNVNGLSVDDDGLIYLSGRTDCDTLTYPASTPTAPVYKDSLRNGEDGYITIFTPRGELYHSHYFGGTGGDAIHNSAVGQNQKLYLVGYTSSNNFPIAYNNTTAGLIDSLFKGGQDGFISRFDLDEYQVTGLTKVALKNDQIFVYPNPANSTINIESRDVFKAGATLKVFNIMGQMIHEEEIKDEKSSISCQSWAKGVYLITLSNTQAQTTFKVVKE